MTDHEGAPVMVADGRQSMTPHRAPVPARGPGLAFLLLRVLAALSSAMVAVVAVSGLELGPTLQVVVMAGFVILGPGAAVLVWWRRPPVALWLSMCAALSVATVIVVAQIMLSTGFWYPHGAVAVVAAGSAVSLILNMVRVPMTSIGGPPGETAVPRRGAESPVGLVGRYGAVAVSVVAVVLWVAGLRTIDPNTLTEVGLVGQLSPMLLVAVALFAAAAIVEIFTLARRSVMVTHLVLAVVGIFGLQTLTYAIARVPVAWLHWGFSEQIARDGAGLLGVDSRYSWPGFFAGLGMIAKATGITDPDLVIAYAPIAFAGLAALAVLAIAGSVLGRGTSRWLAVWIFLTANWVGQEYLSPQGSTVFMMFTALAVVLEFGLKRSLLAGDAVAVPDTDLRWRRIAVWASVAVASIALAPTHQLSPLFLIMFLVILALSRRLTDPLIVLVPIAAVLAWYLTGALSFWQNIGSTLLAGVGDVSSSLNANVGARLGGDIGRQALVVLRILTAAVLVALAVLGLYRLRRAGHEWRVLAAFCFAPFLFVLGQAYGGEMLLRSYLFALPALSIGVACVFAPLARRTAPSDSPADQVIDVRGGRGRTIAAAVLVAFFALSAVVIKGQNDSFVSFSENDLQAAEVSYDVVAPGDRLSGLTASAPLRFDELGLVDQRSVESICSISTMDVACVKRMYPDVLVVSPSQDNSGVRYGRDPGWTTGLVSELVADGSYLVVWHEQGEGNADAWVLKKVQ